MTDAVATRSKPAAKSRPAARRPLRRAQSERREEATNTILDAAEKLVLRMKRDRNEGKPDTAAIEEFLTEVKPYKN